MIDLKEIELTDEQLANVSGGFEGHFRHESDWDRREREEREEEERRRHRHHRGHWGQWHHHRQWNWDD
jgi:bacteriocin-like protein